MVANVCCHQSWESVGTSVSARFKPRKQPVTCLLPYFLGLTAFGLDPKEKSYTNRLCLTCVHNVTPQCSKYWSHQCVWNALLLAVLGPSFTISTNEVVYCLLNSIFQNTVSQERENKLFTQAN